MKLRATLVASMFVAVSVTSATPARAADQDPWFGHDKALHFGASMAIAAGSYVGAVALVDSRGTALACAGALTIAVGAAKEGLDLAGLGDPSWKDLAWDGIGTVAGLVVAWSLDLLVRGVSPHRPALLGPTASARSAPRLWPIAF